MTSSRVHRSNSVRRLAFYCTVTLICASQALAQERLEGLDEDFQEISRNVRPMDEKPEAYEREHEEPSYPSGPGAIHKRFEELKHAHIRTVSLLEKLPKELIGMSDVLVATALMIYGIVYLWGQRKNLSYADTWGAIFAGKDKLLDKNFSYIGCGDSKPITKEAANCFRFYASGRRHVLGMMATLQLRPRQDMLSAALQLVSPSEDELNIEVLMQPSSMPKTVLAVGTPRAIRALQRNQTDVSRYARKINAPREACPHWSNEKLHIVAEHTSVFSDLFSEKMVQQLFNFEGPHARALQCFRYLQFTSDYQHAAHRQMLRFTFALPNPDAMTDLEPLMSFVTLMMDLVGSYKLSPEQARKAVMTRQKNDVEKEEEAKRSREEAMMARRQDKLAEEKAKMARMNPMDRQKYEEKKQKKEKEKQMKRRVVRA